MVRPMTYPEMYMPEEEDYHPTAASWTGFADDIGATEATAIVERLGLAAGLMSAVQLRELGGAVRDVANDATAFAHRDRGIMVNVASIYEGARRDASETWVRATRTGRDPRRRRRLRELLPRRVRTAVRAGYPGADVGPLRARSRPRSTRRTCSTATQNIPPA